MRLRKHVSGADHASGEVGAGGRRRRDGRGWGPFTGGQLTIVIIAFAAMFAIPTVALAADGASTAVATSASSAWAAHNDKEMVIKTTATAVVAVHGLAAGNYVVSFDAAVYSGVDQDSFACFVRTPAGQTDYRNVIPAAGSSGSVEWTGIVKNVPNNGTLTLDCQDLMGNELQGGADLSATKVTTVH